MIRRAKTTALVAAGLIAAATTSAAQAETRLWIGLEGGLWHFPFQWDPAAIPTDSDIVNFNIGIIANPYTVSVISNAECLRLRVLRDNVTFDIFENFTLNPTQIEVGGPVESRMTVQGGGTLNTPSYTRVGTSSGPGVLNVSGTTWNAGGISLGYNDAGTLHVQGNAQVTASSFTVGTFDTSHAEIQHGTVNAPNTDVADGTLEVWGDGTLTATDSMSVGSFEAPEARVDIWGDVNVEALVAGTQGPGDVVVHHGGVLTTNSTTLGNQGYDAAVGTVTVQNLGTWNANDIRVGRATPSQIIIKTGGKLNTYNTAYIGNTDITGALGSVALRNPNSHWHAHADVHIERGSMIMNSDALFTVDGLFRLHTTTSLLLQGGTIRAATMTRHPAADFDFTGGTLIVDDYNGTLVNDGGTIAIGDGAGLMDISSQLHHTGGGTIQVDLVGAGEGGGAPIPGVDHDQLHAAIVNLGSTLEINLSDTYVPQHGDTFTIITAGVLNGTFNTVLGNELPNGGTIDVEYDYDNDEVRLVINFPAPCPADIDGSGTVDVTDLLDLLASWGECADCAADLNNDNQVDVTDLLDMLAAWGDC